MTIDNNSLNMNKRHTIAGMNTEWDIYEAIDSPTNPFARIDRFVPSRLPVNNPAGKTIVNIHITQKRQPTMIRLNLAPEGYPLEERFIEEEGISPTYYSPTTGIKIKTSRAHEDPRNAGSSDFLNPEHICFTHSNSCSCRGSGIGCECKTRCEC
ncbi:uncharacterized protein BX663DRAFT_526190 [Cokeromyces recurvatus]|uniref:uncharacterized protein n=1 Tax=Cokeromyces recurvatus TaxID=90255 RepID=UPI00221EB3B1|nr:uncharacterized protein BX663DRAFT_526190 [Cokeromyces recurvatus]KAI7898093.1 hypothetical protein BX663DRAFT_526190 [Cokeromyces recurvatus]